MWIEGPKISRQVIQLVSDVLNMGFTARRKSGTKATGDRGDLVARSENKSKA
jgi:hypothetical protein